jgi:hypothetical protein
MGKRIVLGVAGVTLFMAGILAGVFVSGGIPAFARSTSATTTLTAQSSTPTGYCQLYEQTLASQLGVSETKLENANSAALQAVINQMAKDGKISSKQQSLLLQALQEYSSKPCSHINQLLNMAKKGNSGELQQLLAGARQSVEPPVAAKLGISTQTLDSDLAAGQSITQIAAARHVALSSVNQAYLGAVQTLLTQAESQGYLTKDQSSAIYSQVSAAVQSGHYPLLESGRKGAQPAA